MEPGEKNILESKEKPKLTVTFVDDYPESIEMAWENLAMDEPALAEHFKAAYVSHANNLSDAVKSIMQDNPEIVFMDNDLKGEFSGPDGPHVVLALRGAGFAGTIVGNSSSGSRPFEEKGAASMMDGFLPDKNEGIKVFLEKVLNR